MISIQFLPIIIEAKTTTSVVLLSKHVLLFLQFRQLSFISNSNSQFVSEQLLKILELNRNTKLQIKTENLWSNTKGNLHHKLLAESRKNPDLKRSGLCFSKESCRNWKKRKLKLNNTNTFTVQKRPREPRGNPIEDLQLEAGKTIFFFTKPTQFQSNSEWIKVADDTESNRCHGKRSHFHVTFVTCQFKKIDLKSYFWDVEIPDDRNF